MPANTTQTQIEDRYGAYAQAVSDNGQPLPFNVDGYAPHTKCAAHTGQTSDTLPGRLYPTADLIDLPTPVLNASLGCGNPLALANLQAGQHVLDLGSGGGIDCFLSTKAVGETGRVIGVDATPKMIALAQANQVKMGVTNVEFRLGQIEALPVESETIDWVISNCVIDISPDKADVFSEAYRVLRPGGCLSISDTVVLGDLAPQLKANIDQWAGAVITPLISLQAYLQYITNAGFVDIKVESLTSYGLENFNELDTESKTLLKNGLEWQPLPPQTGLYSAAIFARKPLEQKGGA